MSQGWISLHRKIREHPLFKEKRSFSKFEAWIYLLLRANYRENQFLLGNIVITVDRGCLLTSIKDLAETWKWSRTKSKNFLEFLQNEKMILFESTTKYTMIEILNYEKYQQIQSKDFDENLDKNESEEHEIDMKEATTKHEENINNKVNKSNNEKEINNNTNAIKASAENSSKDEKVQLKETGKGGYSPDFEELWKVYPRKIEKGKAYRAYKQRIKEGYTTLKLLKSVTQYNQQIKREQTEAKYIKHCSTFIGRDNPFLDYLEGGKDNGIYSNHTAETEDPYDGIGFTI